MCWANALICQKRRHPGLDLAGLLSAGNGAAVDREEDCEALGAGFMFSFTSILAPLDFSFLTYNNSDNEMLSFTEA